MTSQRKLGATIGAVLAAVVLSGCGPEFDSPSILDSLRIIAVQKDRPYAAPGEDVHLTMLWADASPDAGRAVEIAWITGCVNPPGDLYAGCFATGGTPSFASGDEVTITIPSDIITSRPPPSNPKQPAYGLTYVFFAACAGTLEAATDGEFPLRCVDASGRSLGSADFVAGYSAIYVFDEVRNGNPIVRGLSIDGKPLFGGCIDAASAAAAGSDDLGAVLGRAAEGAGPPGANEPPVVCDESFPLDASNPPDCSAPNAPCLPPVPPGMFVRPSLEIRPEIYRASIEDDEVAKVAYDRDYEEQMWINYYTTRGSLVSDVRLLNDATTGLNEDFETLFYPPLEPGPVTLWAAVHDNRGGVAWARGTLWIQ
jgi:hypothetical protein